MATDGKKVAELPDVVGKRNHFEPVGQLIDETFARLPEKFKQPEMKLALQRHTHWVIATARHAFAVGAQRGIEQAARLIEDPEYYRTIKERRFREMARRREDEVRQAAEQLEMRSCPTAKQVEDLRRRLNNSIKEYESWIEDCRERLDALPDKPKLVRFEDGSKK